MMTGSLDSHRQYWRHVAPSAPLIRSSGVRITHAWNDSMSIALLRLALSTQKLTRRHAD